MKILLVYQNIELLPSSLIEEIKKQGFEVVPFKEADEIDQLGNHLGQIVCIFTDSKSAGDFLREYDFRSKFKILNILYVSKTPKITPELQAKLDRIELKLYYPAIEGKLLEELSDFSNNKVSADNELEFLANTDIVSKNDSIT